MIYIFGSSGRLGQALAAVYDPSEVVCVDRSVYRSWSRAGASSAIRSYFSSRHPAVTTIYVCSGLLDPRLSDDELLAVNFLLPKNIIEGVAGLDAKVVTFGTAMEHALTNNSYVKSKLKLGEFVEYANSIGSMATHIRIHTQYGLGEPSPFMFLGQILSSLRTDCSFAMTQGRQLREYHHVDDDAKAIQAIVLAGVLGGVDLSHGKPVTLRELAESIFNAFGKSHLLQLGAIPEPRQENFDRVFVVPECLKKIFFRDAESAVVDYMKSRMNA